MDIGKQPEPCGALYFSRANRPGAAAGGRNFHLMDANKLDESRLPRHIAVIMDGNGRWAKRNAMRRVTGHRAGVEAVRSTVTACREIGIKYLTLYAFSIENWSRPKAEISALMKLLELFLKKELPTMLERGISLRAIGDIERLPGNVRISLRDCIEKTSRGSDMVLILALSYSGRDEIVRAVRKILAEKKPARERGIDTEIFSRYLDTAGIPDPDLLIRTSGEYRISNFLLWQTAYTEFHFTEVLWPDFRKEHLIEAIVDYQNRERRFGNI